MRKVERAISVRCAKRAGIKIAINTLDELTTQHAALLGSAW